jgi:hypothetical protein
MYVSKELIQVTLPRYTIIINIVVIYLSIMQTKGIRINTMGLVVPTGVSRYKNGIFTRLQL